MTTTKTSLLLATLLACTLSAAPAMAAKPAQKQNSIHVDAGNFLKTFEFVTSTDYDKTRASLYTSGLTANINALTLDITSLAGVDLLSPHIAGMNKSGNLTATFADKANLLDLAANTHYRAVITGHAQPGGGTLTLGGTYLTQITPVPEPESYAMLIAGLGLMGFVVSRRRNEKF
ncbi:MAG: PEP-CTERM sorting domain-containing protein [Sterolibacterium sp.]|nr:PEP-CTERM sorting domain-containing protein [Sterolibacterium sp.]